MSLSAHTRQHLRFYCSVLFGVMTWLALRMSTPNLAAMVAGDASFACYLLLMSIYMSQTSIDDLRRRSDVEDEGATLIFVLTGIAIAFCLGSIFSLLSAKPGHTHLLVSLASVPLGWLTFHTMLAMHYARLHYQKSALSSTDKRKDRGGLAFPGNDQPDAWDFLYFSYVIGMTAQVSDVQVEDSGTRRLVLVHSLASFFFNTVLLALAVNVALNVSQ